MTSSCLCDCSSLDVAVPRSSPSALSPSIHHASPSSGSSYLLVSSLLGLLRNGPTQRTYTAVVGFPATDRLPKSYTSSNRDSDTTVRSRGEAGDPPHPSRATTQVRESHTLTQNLKAMGLWVLLLIRCSTFTFLSDVGHITYTCTQQKNNCDISTRFKITLQIVCLFFFK